MVGTDMLGARPCAQIAHHAVGEDVTRFLNAAHDKQVNTPLDLQTARTGRITAATVPAVGSLRKRIVDLFEDIPCVVKILDLVRVVPVVGEKAYERHLHSGLDDRFAGEFHCYVARAGTTYHNTAGATDTLQAADAGHQGLARLPNGLDDGNIGRCGDIPAIDVDAYR